MSVPEEPPDGDFNALVEEEARGRVADARARWQSATVSGSLSAWSGPVLTFSAHNYYPSRLSRSLFLSTRNVYGNCPRQDSECTLL